MGGSAIRASGISRGRIMLLGGMIALLVGIVSVAVQREASKHTASLSATEASRLCIASYFCGRQAASQSAGVANAAQPHALTAEEEVYAGALWTIHSAAKAWAIDLDFAGILYKTEGQNTGKFQ